MPAWGQLPDQDSMDWEKAAAQSRNRMCCHLKEGEDAEDRQKQHVTTLPSRKPTFREGDKEHSVLRTNSVSSTVLSIHMPHLI